MDRFRCRGLATTSTAARRRRTTPRDANHSDDECPQRALCIAIHPSRSRLREHALDLLNAAVDAAAGAACVRTSKYTHHCASLERAQNAGVTVRERTFKSIIWRRTQEHGMVDARPLSAASLLKARRSI